MPMISIPALPSGIFDIALLILFVIVGILIIILIAELLLFVLPAAIVAFIVWFLTGSLFLAGIAFLIVALISLASRD